MQSNSDVDYDKVQNRIFFFFFFFVLNLAQVMKSGYMDKKKVGAKKWEYR